MPLWTPSTGSGCPQRISWKASVAKKCHRWWESFHHPQGVRPQHYLIVRWLGRIGFVAKGIVYAVMGGLCIMTAQHLRTDLTGIESPMGAFVFLGMFSIGTPLLIIMFAGILFYALWRLWGCTVSWEGLAGQGTDWTQSRFSNAFRYRLSPIVSGVMYVFYLVYIGKLLSFTPRERFSNFTTNVNCFPTCWATGDWVHRAGVAIFGLAFLIAFLTQVQNGVSTRWHRDLMIHHCTCIERSVILILGHLGFLARAGVFMFVAVFMFKSLKNPIAIEHDTFSDAINQVISVHGGFIALWFLGVGLILFGLFAVLNAYYKYYPTPPPSRVGYFDTGDKPMTKAELQLAQASRLVLDNKPMPSPWASTCRGRRQMTTTSPSSASTLMVEIAQHEMPI